MQFDLPLLSLGTRLLQTTPARIFCLGRKRGHMNIPGLMSFWEGPISWIERLCVRSVLNAGHRLTIYTYDPQMLRKSGIEGDICDAREVLPECTVQSFRSVGRHALFSDLFRLELQRQNKGISVDLDSIF